MKKSLALSIALMAPLMAGCSSFSESMAKAFLFHPTRDMRVTPQMAGLNAEDVFIQSGPSKIHGWLFPSGQPGRGVVYLHGNGENISQMLMLVKALSPLEFDLLMVDYRGYGQSEGEPGLDEITEDAVAAVDFLANQRGVPPAGIALWGRSLGAAAALQAAVRRPGLAGVIVESGFASLRKIAKNRVPWIPSFIVPNKLDSLSAAASLTIPKLIVHGELDEVIPFEQGLELYQRAKEPKEFLPIAGARHNDLYAKGGPGYFTKIKRWISLL